MIVFFWILVGLVVLVVGFKLLVIANTAKLNNLRRPDGSYADYDFPGLLSSGSTTERPESDLKGFAPRPNSQRVEYDLYGRPLAPEVIERRKGEAEIPKQIVYVLRHMIHEDAEPKLLGIYESLDSVKAAIERFRQLDGFAECPDGFRFAEYELGKDYGDTGVNSN